MEKISQLRLFFLAIVIRIKKKRENGELFDADKIADIMIDEMQKSGRGSKLKGFNTPFDVAMIKNFLKDSASISPDKKAKLEKLLGNA